MISTRGGPLYPVTALLHGSAHLRKVTHTLLNVTKSYSGGFAISSGRMGNFEASTTGIGLSPTKLIKVTGSPTGSFERSRNEVGREGSESPEVDRTGFPRPVDAGLVLVWVGTRRESTPRAPSTSTTISPHVHWVISVSRPYPSIRQPSAQDGRLGRSSLENTRPPER